MSFNSLQEIYNYLSEFDVDDYDPASNSFQEFVENFYEIENEYENFESTENQQLIKETESLISNIRDNVDLYDAEGELDMMYPDRHDEDFDEDSISGTDFFGD